MLCLELDSNTAYLGPHIGPYDAVISMENGQMELTEAETRLGITLPEQHRRAMLDQTDPIHKRCVFLILNSPYELLRWVDVNEFLHKDNWNPWPQFLVAFAGNGCGDYFAYDLRSDPPRIIYIDPDYYVEENLTNEEPLVYVSFEEWYTSHMTDLW